MLSWTSIPPLPGLGYTSQCRGRPGRAPHPDGVKCNRASGEEGAQDSRIVIAPVTRRRLRDEGVAQLGRVSRQGGLEQAGEPGQAGIDVQVTALDEPVG